MLDIPIKRPRKPVAAVVALLPRKQRKQRGWIAHRCGTEDKTAHHGEDGGIGADAEADREYGNRGDGGVLEECAKTVAQIARQRLEPGQSAALAQRLAGLLCATQANEGLSASFDRSEPGADAGFSMHRHVAFELGVEVVAGSAGTKKVNDAHTEGAQSGSNRVHHGLLLYLSGRREKAGQNLGGLLPIGRGFAYLPLAGPGQLIELC